MKYIIFTTKAFVAWALIVSMQTAGAEALVQRTFEIHDIQKIEVGGGGNLEIRIGAKERLDVTAPRSIMEKITVDAKSDTLRIHQKGHSLWQKITGKGTVPDNQQHAVKYRLTLTTLSSIKANGHFEVKVLDPISSANFTIHLTGASTLNLPKLALLHELELHATGASDLKIENVTANKMTVHGSGASTLHAAGVINMQKVHVSGASNYLAHNLQSQRAEIHASGASNIELWVEKKLESNLSGASNVSYYGSPTEHAKNSGASTVTKISDKP